MVKEVRMDRPFQTSVLYLRADTLCLKASPVAYNSMQKLKTTKTNATNGLQVQKPLSCFEKSMNVCFEYFL